MDEFLGKDYQMVSEEGFETYLVHIGLGLWKRKVASNLRPTQTLKLNDNGTYTLHVRAAIFNWDIIFTPGVEFDAHKPDGNKVKGLITFDGNVMTHRQTDDEGRISTHVLVFSPEEIIVTTTVEGTDIVAKRVYKLV